MTRAPLSHKRGQGRYLLTQKHVQLKVNKHRNGVGSTPVLPLVGSITMLLSGISTPSFSASRTIRLAMRSLTDPPTEKNSVFPTKSKGEFRYLCAAKRRTQIALEPLCCCQLVKAYERCVAYGIKSIIKDGIASKRHVEAKLSLGLNVGAGHSRTVTT